jgi:hypothetical protein
MGSYQSTPNVALPGVFVATAHDLGDPCYRGANCTGTKWAQVYAHSYMGEHGQRRRTRNLVCVLAGGSRLTLFLRIRVFLPQGQFIQELSEQ